MTPGVLAHALWSGLALSVFLGFSFVGVSLLNQEIWLGDLPDDIQRAWGPQGRKARIQKWVFGAPILALALVGVVLSTTQMIGALDGQASFLDVFAHTLIALSVFNLFDLLILDWLILVRMKPGFAILPGTEGLAGWDDYGFHFHAFLIGSAGILVVSLVAAGLTTLL